MRSTLRTLLGLIAVLVLALGVAACGGDDDNEGGDSGGDQPTGQVQSGGTAKFNYASFPDYMDPAMSYTVAGWQALIPTYTPLLTYKREAGATGAQLMPGLAEAMPEVTNGGKTYKLKLRSGLKYSDGSPVKASDFEHTIKRVITLESGGAPFYVGAIKGAEAYQKAGKPKGDISGIDADDATGEITIELNEASGQFPFILSMDFAGLVPSSTPFEVLTKKPPPGVGQFKITKVDGSRGFTLEKNENFPEIPGLEPAKLDKIEVTVVKNGERQVRDVLQNQADYLDDPSAGDALTEFQQQAPNRYKEFTTNSTYYYFLNHRTKPFDNEKVRQAVAYGIDKRAIIRIYGGLMEPGCNFLPPGMEGHEPIDPCPYGDPTQPPDIEKARSLIKEAGAEGEEVLVWGNDEDDSKQNAEYLSDVLNEIGLKSRPKIIEGSVFFTTVGNQKTKAQAGFTNWFQDFPHPGNFLFLVDGDTIQPTNNQNFGNVEVPEIDKKIDELNPMELSEAASGYAEIDRQLIEGAHVVPYGSKKIPLITSERIAFEDVLFHPVLQVDYASIGLKEGQQ
ncbi:MAG TPA: ABC transporter substrate-binding protein [Solirubrobacteraceae bacterium]|jgi:peptide/nickel transport system substrate-binding protein